MSITLQEAIARLVDRRDLSGEEAAAAMAVIMEGNAAPSLIGAFLVALRMKGETSAEIAGCARAMRAKVTRIAAPLDVIDTCGTGGDRSGTLNVSTAAAIVAAGAGARVAKHGNRSVSSKSGSADVLRELGVNVEAPAAVVERCLVEAGIGFLYAPLLHPAMKHAIGPRRELGLRTVFNVLGPLTNPAGARRQSMGVFSAEMTEVMAAVLRDLGSERAFVVHGEDGLDEVSVSGPTRVTELRNGDIRTRTVQPADFGLPQSRLDDLKVDGPAASAAALRKVLAGEKGPMRDFTVANAAAAIAVAGRAETFADAAALAVRAINSGAARGALEKWIEWSRK
jgi:anthranilate phosphoribosyltransferase